MLATRILAAFLKFGQAPKVDENVLLLRHCGQVGQGGQGLQSGQSGQSGQSCQYGQVSQGGKGGLS